MEALRSILRTRRIHRPRDDGQALSEQPSALTHCSGPPVSVHETLPRREQRLIGHKSDGDDHKHYPYNLIHRAELTTAEWQERFHCRRTKTVGLRPTVFGPLLDGRDGRPSIRPKRLLRGCCCRRSTRCQNNTNSRWAIDARTVASCGRCRVLDTRSHDDHWTRCSHPETAHNTVSSYDCTVR